MWRVLYTLWRGVCKSCENMGSVTPEEGSPFSVTAEGVECLGGHTRLQMCVGWWGDELAPPAPTDSCVFSKWSIGEDHQLNICRLYGKFRKKENEVSSERRKFSITVE